MGQGGYRYWGKRVFILAAVASLPAAAFGDETRPTPTQTDEYFSTLEDLSLRRTISDLTIVPTQDTGANGDDGLPVNPYAGFEGGSAGGYVNIGGPATSTFLTSTLAEREQRLLDRVEFGVDWRPDVSSASIPDSRPLGRSVLGGEPDRIGLRADVTALLRNEGGERDTGTAWRVSGMLGSTSLSLMEDEGEAGSEIDDLGHGLLWDVAVGWSSGAMSLNAGYQSTFSLNETGDDMASVAVLSLGADYSLLPGLSVYGELNMIDSPLESSGEGFGAVVVVGTGVSF
jgi:hypothetical protein